MGKTVIKSFNSDLEFNKDKVVAKLIMQTEFSKEIRITLKEGQIMKEHKAPKPIIVHLLSGNIDFGVEGNLHRMKQGDIITLESNVVHELHALKDSVIRLSISKSDNIERVEQVANN